MAAGGTRRTSLRQLLAALLLLAACSGNVADDSLRDAAPALEPLPDGTHFGFVVALDPTDFALTFDEAELLHGDDATAAAEADGTVVTEEGSYVRNAEELPRPVVLDEDLQVRLLRPCCTLHAVSFEDWRAGFVPDDRSFYGTARSYYELTVEDGRAVTVDEVHVP